MLKSGICTLLLSISVYAAESKIVTIEGSVRSFDKDFIQITTNKRIRSIPRKFIPAGVSLKSGNPVKIPLSDEQLQEVK